jgi:hypothetical protein
MEIKKMSYENPISRRDLITHLGAGIAGAAITAAAPTAQAQATIGSTAAPFVDPRANATVAPFRSRSEMPTPR